MTSTFDKLSVSTFCVKNLVGFCGEQGALCKIGITTL